MVEFLKIDTDENASFSTLTEEGLQALTVKVPTFLEEIKARVGASELGYAPGCAINTPDESGFDEALAAANAAAPLALPQGA